MSDTTNKIIKSVKSINPYLAGRQACKSPDWIGTGEILTNNNNTVKAHAGKITVESKENEGTKFIINLPLNL